MEIKEVKEFEFKALSKDRIKIGCKEFTREYIQISCGWSDQAIPFAIHWDNDGKNYYAYTKADCDRALKLMDEFKERPEPKFKVGDRVKCSCDIHLGDNPYIIGATYYGTNEWQYGVNSDYCICNEDHLLLVPPEPRFKPWTWVKVGTQHCLLHEFDKRDSDGEKWYYFWKTPDGKWDRYPNACHFFPAFDGEVPTSSMLTFKPGDRVNVTFPENGSYGYVNELHSFIGYEYSKERGLAEIWCNNAGYSIPIYLNYAKKVEEEKKPFSDWKNLVFLDPDTGEILKRTEELRDEILKLREKK